MGLNVGDICEEIPEGLAVENTGKETAEHLAAEGLGGATDASEGEALAGHTEEAGRVNDDQAINDPGNREEAEVIEPREGEAVAAEAVVVADDSNASSVDAAAAANIPKDARKHDGGAVAPVPRPDDAETAAEVRVAAVASVAIRPALVSYRRRSDASRAGAARGASDSAPVGPEWRIPAKHHWNPDSASSRGLCSGHLRYVRQTKLGWDILAYNTINEDSVPREEFVMDGQLKLERVGDTQGRAGRAMLYALPPMPDPFWSSADKERYYVDALNAADRTQGNERVPSILLYNVHDNLEVQHIDLQKFCIQVCTEQSERYGAYFNRPPKSPADAGRALSRTMWKLSNKMRNALRGSDQQAPPMDLGGWMLAGHLAAWFGHTVEDLWVAAAITAKPRFQCAGLFKKDGKCALAVVAFRCMSGHFSRFVDPRRVYRRLRLSEVGQELALMHHKNRHQTPSRNPLGRAEAWRECISP